ncbi:nitrilase-related carbon-nitrogen hydrolase [Streptomyces sp. GMR22]|uniref:nitrilase-related carbon-nitrogen hydrolase n=1 Tax=Streptomyces sp. GMR22 TaxID=2759524 RepID=UPI0015FAF9AF|nr:nitrilase-related carbon-nitrogen hydrolase [Streptomyces sp. GMR22]MBA6440764.1 hypothetical protein [Streptomyces sp. GMR22]
MTSLRIAVAQFELRAENSFDDFADHVRAVVERAVRQRAEAVVLPELVTTGLLATVTGHVPTVATVATDYRTIFPAFTEGLVDLYQSLAATHAITVVGGSHLHLADDGSLRNTCFLVHPDGRVETQDKLHLTPPEHQLGAVGGDEVLITRIGPFTAAVQICADIEFPEVSRHLVKHGVDLILCPSLTWNRRGARRVRYGAHARAMENQLYVLGSPLIGSSGLPDDAPLYGAGRAFAAAPIDRVLGRDDGLLAISDRDGEDILIADLEPHLLRQSRAEPEVPGLALRRRDLYRRLDVYGPATPAP